MALKGMSDVLRKLNREINKIKNKSVTGMQTAVLLVKADAIKNTPVDTGNLRASAFTRVHKAGSLVVGEIGFTATYALYVHEIPNNYKVGNWQFLRDALVKNETTILKLLQQSVEIKR